MKVWSECADAQTDLDLRCLYISPHAASHNISAEPENKRFVPSTRIILFLLLLLFLSFFHFMYLFIFVVVVVVVPIQYK